MSQELSLGEKYKRMAAFYYLKHGRHIVRKGLIKRIVFLALQRDCHIRESRSLNNFLNRHNLFYLPLCNDEGINEIKKTCSRYLQNDFLIETEWGDYLDFFYRKESVRWDLLDEDLISLYPQNIKIKNNIPFIINYHVNDNSANNRFTVDPYVNEGGEEDSSEI